jgi:hypothetical protein
MAEQGPGGRNPLGFLIGLVREQLRSTIFPYARELQYKEWLPTVGRSCFADDAVGFSSSFIVDGDGIFAYRTGNSTWLRTSLCSPQN